MENIEALPQEIQEILRTEKFSKSEKNGLNLLTNNDLSVYSPGISTGGVAEIKMALQNKDRKIVTTSLDKVGIVEIDGYIRKSGLDRQIAIKVEDVSEPLDYQDDTFDYVYARLLLHYLDRDQLDSSLINLNRVLKPDKKLFVVVRSIDDPDTKIEGTTYNFATGLSTYSWRDVSGAIHPEKRISRYFHSQKTITDHLSKASFKILSIDQYDEQLYLDFARKKLSPIVGNVIEVVAEK